jgi:hypothetical protein
MYPAVLLGQYSGSMWVWEGMSYWQLADIHDTC